MFSTYLAAGAVLIALAAMYIAAQAVSYARSCQQWIEDNNKNSLGLKRIMELEAELTDQRDAMEAVRKGLHKLRSRIAMRTLNEERKQSTSDIPDPVDDPEGWKRWANANLVSNGAGEHEQ